jgi:DNA-binding NarL/FixJ family response regulator
MLEEKTKILVADDHAILRHGLRRILEAETDMTVIGEAGNGVEAVERTHQLNPDIVIMEISMPGQDGLESLRQIVNTHSRVLILSMRLERQTISEAVSAGASGYLAKDTLDNELVAAVRTVVQGGTVFSSNVSRILASSQQSVDAAVTLRSVENLTPREREVFLLLAEGRTPAEVASSLFLSAKTVHTHRQHIMEKLRLRTTTELIRFALREGLIKTV